MTASPGSANVEDRAAIVPVSKPPAGRSVYPFAAEPIQQARPVLLNDDDFPQVLAALRRGLEDRDAGKAARTAIAYVQLVYGRQLQQPSDEATQSDPLEVASMSREERDALKRRILSRHPHLVTELRGE